MLRTVRLSIVTIFALVLANACIPAPVAPTAPARPASFGAAPSATAAPPPRRITRPPAPNGGDPPVLLRALPEAGTFASRSGQWRYDGLRGTLEHAAAIDEPLEHPAPAGTLVAIERQTRTPGGFAISNELAIRDATGGHEQIVYRGPELFYWSGWSPDGRYVSVWEVDSYSGSVDLDGRPLLVIDAATGQGSFWGGRSYTEARPGRHLTRWPSSPVWDEQSGRRSSSDYGRPRPGSGT